MDIHFIFQHSNDHKSTHSVLSVRRSRNYDTAQYLSPSELQIPRDINSTPQSHHQVDSGVLANSIMHKVVSIFKLLASIDHPHTRGIIFLSFCMKQILESPDRGVDRHETEGNGSALEVFEKNGWEFGNGISALGGRGVHCNFDDTDPEATFDVVAFQSEIVLKLCP